MPLVLLVQITAFSQEYTYDPNGNLDKDANKQIASIHYNHLNLVDTITYEDNRRIIYTYAASGQKLSQQVIEANGTLRQKRDYDSHFIYERDTLREIQHGEGRLVPVAPGDAGTPLEYQYHLKDQLGDVRATLTAAPQTDTVMASFDTVTAPFLRYESARRVNAVLFDHTQKASAGETHHAQCLNGSVNGRYGLAKSIAVMPGDTVKLEVYAKYVNRQAANLTAALTALLGQIAAGAASGIVADGPAYAAGGAPFPFAGLNNTSSSTSDGPKAYLNYLFFDTNFAFQSGGYVRMSTAAEERGLNGPHERLAATVVARQPGFVYAYLSNEESSVEVYFDDFAVTHIQGPVIRQTDYDPFGLAFNEFSRENAAPNKFLYNGKELQGDFDLNVYDYGARMYDAALGRWHVIDPLAEKYAGWSPYNYVMNNPVKSVDPDGREPIRGRVDTPEIKDYIREAYGAIESVRPGRELLNSIIGSKYSVFIEGRNVMFQNYEIIPWPKEDAVPANEVLASGMVGTGKGSNVRIELKWYAFSTASDAERVDMLIDMLTDADQAMKGEATQRYTWLKGKEGEETEVPIAWISAIDKGNAIRSSLGLPIKDRLKNASDPGDPILLIGANGKPLDRRIRGFEEIQSAYPPVKNVNKIHGPYDPLNGIRVGMVR